MIYKNDHESLDDMRQQISTEILQPENLTSIPTSGLRDYVKNLALAHGIVYTKTPGDAWAETVTRLAGDEVVTDDVEDLIVALKRNHVINATTMVTLLGNYLDERNHV